MVASTSTALEDRRALKLLDDPVVFTKACWPDIRLYDKQAEILRSLRDNPETVVHAANEVGKDFISAIGALWWFCSREPAKIITTSSSETQLASVLWGEIRQRIDTSRIPLGLLVNHMIIRRRRSDGTIAPQSELLGKVARKGESFQGFHLPHDRPRVLVIMDEASGIEDQFYEAAESFAHHKLIVGNPLNTTNFFYRICKGGDAVDPSDPKGERLYRKVIHVSAEHSPNVVAGKARAAKGLSPPHPTIVPGVVAYDTFLQREAYWDEVKKTSRLYGHFYEGADALLYPSEWLDLAERRHATLVTPHNRRTPEALGVDGGQGRDKSAFTLIDRYGVIEQTALRTPDTMEIAGRVIRMMDDNGLKDSDVAIDGGGGGKQIADRLAELGRRIRVIYFGASPTPPNRFQRGGRKKREDKEEAEDIRLAYKNRRAEMYGLLRSLLDPSLESLDDVKWPRFALPADLTDLRRELAPIPLWYDSEGKMYLPPKDSKPGAPEGEVTIKKLVGHSPDRADSLVLAVYAMVRRETRRKTGGLW